MTELKTRTIQDLKNVLKDKESINGREDAAYYMLRGNPNITIILQGLMGDEFIKTYGHYHKDNREENYQVLFGDVIFILQRMKDDNPQEVLDIKTIRLTKDDKVKIPKNYGHCVVNVGSTPAVLIDDAPANAENEINDYEKIKIMCGFAIYIVQKNGKIEFERNKNYKY